MDYTTDRALNIISKIFKMRKKYINISGNKDKNGITEQFFSISCGPKRNIDLKNIKVEYIGRSNERINLGSHYENEFEVVVRNIDEKPEELAQYINYYDDQRFGLNKNNHLIGKLIIEKNFEEACKLIGLKYEGRDFVRALRTLPKKILWLYVHSYQSYLWNNEVSGLLNKHRCKSINHCLGKLNVPIEKLDNFKMNLKKFDDIKELPEIKFEDVERDIFMSVKNLELSELEDDELNEGMKKINLKFSLGNGSYATILIKCLF